MLQVQQKPEVGQARLLWIKSNDQGTTWRQARIDVPPILGLSTYQQIYF